MIGDRALGIWGEIKLWRQIQNERFGFPGQVFYIARVKKRFYHTSFLLGLHSRQISVFSNNVFYFVGFQNNFWLGRIWNLLYRLRHEVGFKTLTTKLIYLIVFCWPPSRSASGQLRMDNQIPGGGYWQRIGHFRVPLCLCFKASLSAKPFLWKWLWFAWKWNRMRNSFS